MKNILFVSSVFCLALAGAQAQSHSGKLNLSAGIGFEPTTLMDNANVNTPPLTFKVGYQVTPMFSLNGFAGYSSTTSESVLISDGALAQTANRQTFLGLRGELKKEIGERFEVYGGAVMGYTFQNIDKVSPYNGQIIVSTPGQPTAYDPNAAKGQMLYTGFVGTTFFVQKHVGIFAELGYGVSLFNAGISVRI
ncbi:MAG: outer membrane beta-barrel protein [Bacteroidetes bacterium]|nr:outer membrane beta-barrel protein [Bacteroidota bacterium]